MSDTEADDPNDEPNPFLEIAALLEAPPDVLEHAARRLVEHDPVTMFRATLPGRSPRAQIQWHEELRRQEMNRSVRRTLDEMDARERRGDEPLAAPITLSEMLAEPDEDATYLVDDLWPRDGKIVLAAKNKSGKTTLIGNLIRSLVDGTKFLDFFEVQPADRVVLIDDELSPAMIKRWLREQDIGNADRVDVISLRGRTSTFDVLDRSTRAEWAHLIGSADVLIFDCLRPALDALGLSEDKDSGRFLEALDELVAEAGIGHLGVVHHMGHSDERSRGDSRIEDWPDAKWRLTRLDPGDDSSARFFSAYGRDVDQPEMELTYSEFGRRLSVKPGGGSRASARLTGLRNEVLRQVSASPGLTKNALMSRLTGDDKDKRRAVHQLVTDGLVVLRYGPNGSQFHYLPEDDPYGLI